MTETNKDILAKITRRDRWIARLAVAGVLGGLVAGSVFFLSGGC